MDFANEKFDIILLAGQSNSEGSGVGPTAEEYLPDGVVYHMFGSKKHDGKQWILNFPVEIRIEETDAAHNATMDGHYKSLIRLFADTREQCGNMELPIIAGDFCYQWKSTHEEKCAPVIDAIRLAMTELGGGFVETSDLHSNDQDGTKKGDDIHFSRNSVHILGRRYFDAYKRILEVNKKEF